jgi:hypothetical protein
MACFSLVLSMRAPRGRMEPARTNSGMVSMGAATEMRWPPWRLQVAAVRRIQSLVSWLRAPAGRLAAREQVDSTREL